MFEGLLRETDTDKMVLPMSVHVTYPEYVLMNFRPLHSDEAAVCQQLLQA